MAASKPHPAIPPLGCPARPHHYAVRQCSVRRRGNGQNGRRHSLYRLNASIVKQIKKCCSEIVEVLALCRKIPIIDEHRNEQ